MAALWPSLWLCQFFDVSISVRNSYTFFLRVDAPYTFSRSGNHFRGVTEMVWFRHKLCCVFVTVSVSRYTSFISTDTHFTYERADYKIAAT